MLRTLQIIFLCCGILTLLALGGFAIAYYLASNSLPIYQQTFITKNVKDTVKISRDSYAVPYISGLVASDSFFALGYAHAQDRLWQMVFSRRMAQGRLSEILGRSALESDILMRTLNIYNLSQKAEKKQSEEINRLLLAYSNGVNTFINEISNSGLGRGSPEFFLYTSQVAPWRPTDSLALMKMMGLLSTNKAKIEILRTRLMLEELDGARLEDLFNEPPLINALETKEYNFFKTSLRPDKNFNESERMLLSQDYTESFLSNINLPASNIFAVGPTRSATGATIAANDPHGTFSAPANFMLVGMSYNSKAAIGATIPGIPAIIVGRNKNIGWGIANAYIDDQDLFVEKINPRNKFEYFTPSGVQKFEKTSEIINIKDENPISIDIRKTKNGPVLAYNIYGVDAVRPEGHEISLSWTGSEEKDRSIEAFISLMMSESIEAGRKNLPLLQVPSQNILLADKNNIGIFTAGAVPKRSRLHTTKGKIPSLGWQKNNGWLGFQLFEEKPFTQNPGSGIVINTNNKTTVREFPYHLSFDWGDSQRIVRATSLLQKRQYHTINSIVEIQNDTVSISAKILLPLLAKQLWFGQPQQFEKAITSQANNALDVLSEWNGDMNPNSPAPLIYASWIREFQKMVIADEVGDLYSNFRNIRPLFLERVLRSTNGASRWCNIKQTEELETCNDISKRALIKSIKQLKEKFGSEVNNWRWGNAHVAVHKSNLSVTWPMLSYLTNIVHEVPGGDNTILMSRMLNTSKNQFVSNYGSTLKAIYDFSLNNSALFVVSTGQSGHFLSKHYDDQSTLWQNKQYLPLKLDMKIKQRNSVGTITFEPASFAHKTN